jgi:hypothetical protein
MAFPDFYFFPTTTHPAQQQEWQGMMTGTIRDGVLALSDEQASLITVPGVLGMFEVKQVDGDSVAIATGVAWISGYTVVNKITQFVDLDYSTVYAGSSRVDLIVLTLNFPDNTITAKVRMGTSLGAPLPTRTTNQEYDFPLATATLKRDSAGVQSMVLTDQRVVANATGGTHRGPIYQRPDSPTAIGKGEMWYVTEPAVQRGLYIFDDRQGTTAPAWQPMVSSKIVTSAQDGGYNPSQSTIQTGSESVNTNSDGVFHIGFPEVFPNSIISVVVTNSDIQRGIMAGCYYVVLNKYPTGFTGMSVRYQFTRNEDSPNDPSYFTVDPYAFPLNSPITVDWIAIGW